MNRIITIISLLRIKQWYKNVIIFFGIVFGLELLSPENIIISIFGFIALCLITSSGYIRNDIIDLEKDKIHPDKQQRPLPSGKITIKQAHTVFLIIFGIGISLSFFLNPIFGLFMIALIINTEIYSRITKNIVFLDVFAIGINFVIRAVSGIILINTAISPWIILGVFFIALFLGFVKRKSEKITLKDSAINHRKVLGNYTNKSLNISVFLSAMMILITYTTYATIGHFLDGRLLLTVPFIIFAVIRQLQLSKINHPLIQKNEFYKDKPTGICLITYSIFTLILLYTDFFISLKL